METTRTKKSPTKLGQTVTRLSKLLRHTNGSDRRDSRHGRKKTETSESKTGGSPLSSPPTTPLTRSNKLKGLIESEGETPRTATLKLSALELNSLHADTLTMNGAEDINERDDRENSHHDCSHHPEYRPDIHHERNNSSDDKSNKRTEDTMDTDDSSINDCTKTSVTTADSLTFGDSLPSSELASESISPHTPGDGGDVFSNHRSSISRRYRDVLGSPVRRARSRDHDEPFIWSYDEYSLSSTLMGKASGAASSNSEPYNTEPKAPGLDSTANSKAVSEKHISIEPTNNTIEEKPASNNTLGKATEHEFVENNSTYEPRKSKSPKAPMFPHSPPLKMCANPIAIDGETIDRPIVIDKPSIQANSLLNPRELSTFTPGDIELELLKAENMRLRSEVHNLKARVDYLSSRNDFLASKQCHITGLPRVLSISKAM